MLEKKFLSSKTKVHLRYLREHGYSLPEISKLLSVPKATVYYYVKNIKIFPEYQQEYFLKRGGNRKRKQLKEIEAINKAGKFLDKITDREKLILLSSIYWGEGSKKDFGLSNTDPNLIKIFVRLLYDVLNISKDRLRISIRIYEDLDKNKCLSFWSKIVDIPVEKFVNVNVLFGKKIGKLQYGMCRVRILKGGDELKFIKAINSKIVDLLMLP